MMRLVGLLLALALAIVRLIERRRALADAERLVVARQLEELARQARVAREIDGQVAIMSEDEINAELDEYGWLRD